MAIVVPQAHIAGERTLYSRTQQSTGLLLPNSLLAMLAEFGVRFESVRSIQKGTAHAVPFCMELVNGLEPPTC